MECREDPTHEWEESEGGPLHCGSTVYRIGGLPGGKVLEAQELSLRVRGKGRAQVRVTARMALPEPTQLVASDVTVRVGNVSQLLPAERFQPTATGTATKIRKGRPASSVSSSTTRRPGRCASRAAGARRTRADHVILSLESSEWWMAQSLRAERRGDTLRFSASP